MRQAKARRLRWVARAHVLALPVALWLPLLVGSRGARAVIAAALLLSFLLMLAQFVPLGAPRTMRRRYRRLTGQADLIALAGFALLALAIVTGTRLSFVALGTIAVAAPIAALLLVSPSVYLIPHPEDVQRP